MKLHAGTMQTEQLVKPSLAADGVIITAVKYRVITLITRTRQPARIIMLIYLVHGAILTAVRRDAGIIITSHHAQQKIARGKHR